MHDTIPLTTTQFDTNDLLRVQLLCYDNPRRAHQIISSFESYAHFQSQFDQFILTIKQESHRKLFRNRFNVVSQQASLLLDKKTTFISFQDPNYPSALREISYFPLILFFSGSIRLASTPQIAVVGSRKCSDYGKEIIQHLLPDLLPHFSITSGLASGIDTIAHRHALDHHSPTIAVIGNGLDVVYPSENAGLYKKIADTGLILSEFPPGTPGRAYHFPQRNRIVSGLSKATLVIEATEKSGALITANHALEQNRDVFAVPGKISTKTSKGCHRLIQDGAKLVQNSRDILEEFQIKSFKKPLQSIQKDFTAQPEISLSKNESTIISVLTPTPQPFDQLATMTKFPVQTLLQTLTLLEVKGLIAQHAGQRFSRK